MLLAAAALLIGSGGLDLQVIVTLRAPRVTAAAGVGALLALSGFAMQVLLRNPLADPYVLGVSGGAGVGALLALLAGVSLWLGAALGALAALAFASACSSPAVADPDPAAPVGPNALVVRVIDGDTVLVSIGGAEESARLIGIDTPETKRPDTPVECFGPEASDRLHALLPPGTPVRLELDQEPRDRYGRLLVYLHRGTDDAFVNEVMAREGLADALSIAPNTAFESRFAAEVETARTNRIGLWANCPDAHSPAG